MIKIVQEIRYPEDTVITERTEQYRMWAVAIAKKIQNSLDDKFGIIKEIMDMRLCLLIEEGLTEGEIRLAMAYIDLVIEMYHDHAHLECIEELFPEIASELNSEKKREKGH